MTRWSMLDAGFLMLAARRMMSGWMVSGPCFRRDDSDIPTWAGVRFRTGFTR